MSALVDSVYALYISLQVEHGRHQSLIMLGWQEWELLSNVLHFSRLLFSVCGLQLISNFVRNLGYVSVYGWMVMAFNDCMCAYMLSG